MLPRVSLGILLGLILALGSVTAQEPASGGEVWCVGGFEPGAKDRPHDARFGSAAAEAGGAVGKHHLRWELKASRLKSRLRFAIDADLSGFSRISFHVRAVDRPLAAGALQLNLRSSLGRFTAPMPAVGTEWKRIEIPLIAFSAQLIPDRRRISALEFQERKVEKPRVVHLDHVCLHRHPHGWRGGVPRRLDFERPYHITTADATGSRARGVPDEASGGTKRKPTVEWKVPAGKKWVGLNLSCLPEDVRGCGALRFRVRVDRPVKPDEIYLRICTTEDEFLEMRLPALKKRRWIRLTLPLADFRATRSVDPSRIRTLEVLGWDLAPLKMSLAKIELTRGRRGTDSWRPDGKHLVARIFGAKRAGKVKRLKTKHFEVWTDSKAAQGRFVRSLDEHVAFVCRRLAMPRPKDRIPVYLFRNAEGYRDFCVRCAGFTEEEAAGTAGHGGARYFAAYFTRHDSPVVVHELTHTLVCRTHGSWGGSWLHEGFAVYVESAFESKDPVKEFAVHLRNGRHDPLAKFLTEESLASSGSRKESNRVSRLYDQAGAFFAFLKDGPHRGKFPELVKRLMKEPGEARDRVKVIEKLYDRSLADLEKEWVAWGTKRR